MEEARQNRNAGFDIKCHTDLDPITCKIEQYSGDYGWKIVNDGFRKRCTAGCR